MRFEGRSEKIYIAIQKNPEITIHNLWKSSSSPNQLPSEQPEILRNSDISKGKVQTKPVDGLFLNKSHERI